MAKTSAATTRYEHALRRAAESLREGRKADLDDRRRSFDEDTWEWNDRRWYWPGGESLRYFEALSPSEAAVIARFCDRYGFALEGVGTSRVVLRTPEPDSVRPGSGRTDAVVKLPRYGVSTDLPEGVYAPGFDGGEGRDQNRVEAALWRRTTADFLLPVRSVHEEFLWLTMPAATPLADLDVPTGTVLDDFRARAATLDGRLHLDEVTPENVGRWRGDWYLLDYGRPPLETE